MTKLNMVKELKAIRIMVYKEELQRVINDLSKLLTKANNARLIDLFYNKFWTLGGISESKKDYDWKICSSLNFKNYTNDEYVELKLYGGETKIAVIKAITKESVLSLMEEMENVLKVA